MPYLFAVRSTIALPLLLERASAGSIGKLLLGSGVLAGAGGMAFFYLALGGAEVSRVKPIAFALAPATAVLLAWLFLGEGLGLSKLAGLVLILSGVFLLTSGGGH